MKEIITSIVNSPIKNNNMLKCKKYPITNKQYRDILQHQGSLFYIPRPGDKLNYQLFGQSIITEDKLFGGDDNEK